MNRRELLLTASPAILFCAASSESAPRSTLTVLDRQILGDLLAESLGQGPAKRAVIQQESLTIGSFATYVDHPDPRTPPRVRELLRELRRRNHTRVKLAGLPESLVFAYVPAARIQTVLEQSGWEGFYKEYPDSAGYMNFSLPAVNARRTEAVVFVQSFSYYLAAEGRLLRLVRKQGHWQTAEMLGGWIS